MLSLPLPPPQQAPALTSRFRPRPESPPPNVPASQLTALHRQQQQRRDEERKAHNTRSPLALLMADEAAIIQRKQAIRDFGSYWIRPPGISKTLQAMRDEEQERLEQEEFARQESGWRDMQAVQEQEEARQRAAEATATAETDPEAERNLDDDIPDADADVDADAEAEESADEPSFNEDSVMAGSRMIHADDLGMDRDLDELEEEHEIMEADIEEAELIGAAQDEADLGMDEDRDLDDSIPDAASFEQSDSDIEVSVSESDSDIQDSFAMRLTQNNTSIQVPALAEMASPRRSARRIQITPAAQQRTMNIAPIGGLQERMRAQVDAADLLPRSPGSLQLGSSMIGSSFMESSPILQRGAQAGRPNRRGNLAPQSSRRS